MLSKTPTTRRKPATRPDSGSSSSRRKNRTAKSNSIAFCAGILTTPFPPRYWALPGEALPSRPAAQALVSLQAQLHERFRLRQINDVNFRKQFFRVSLKETREEIEKLGVTTGVSWTETAHAREYYESLAIEKEISDKPDARERWVKRQLNMRVAMGEGSRPSGEMEDED